MALRKTWDRRTSKSKWEHVLKEAQKPARTSRRARSIALPRVVAAQVSAFQEAIWTSVYSYNEAPNVIVRRHGHDHVIYGENEPSVTISKSKRRHYYGTAYAPGVTTYDYRHRHLYSSSSSASIGISKSESISRSKTRVGSAGTISKSSSSKSRNAANGAGFKGRTMAKGNEMSGGPNKHSKSSSLAQGKRTGMNQSSGSNQGSAPRRPVTQSKLGKRQG